MTEMETKLEGEMRIAVELRRLEGSIGRIGPGSRRKMAQGRREIVVAVVVAG
jgi:hypothetical protein